jgi:hypothetical protein
LERKKQCEKPVFGDFHDTKPTPFLTSPVEIGIISILCLSSQPFPHHQSSLLKEPFNACHSCRTGKKRIAEGEGFRAEFGDSMTRKVLLFLGITSGNTMPIGFID